MLEFATLTVTEVEVFVFPATSRATTVMVCVPFDTLVVFHDAEYGDVVSSAPRFAPSALNRTPETPALSEAVAEMVTVPETVVLCACAVKETVGGVVS